MTLEAMENMRPPLPSGKFKGEGAVPAKTRKTLVEPSVEISAPSLSGIARVWSDVCQNCSGGQPVSCCQGGQKFENNCAHFLSDAMVRAGFTDLLSDGALFKCHHENCTLPNEKRRPIRAREMWDWFKRKATDKKEGINWDDIPRNSGWWAIFQYEEGGYWGGHVIVLNTEAWVYYGTCNYPEWKQYLYQW